jgi:hypothetical protein
MLMLSRAEWGMPGPLGPRMKSSKGLFLHHSVTRATADPVRDARTIANIGIQRFGRMSYSFVVHPDGTILEGQNGHVGAHTRGQNSTTQAICCVGNFENDRVTPEMVASIRILVRDFGPLLGGHRDAPGAATACPGRNLYAMMSTLRVPAEASPEPSRAPEVPSGGVVAEGGQVSADATTGRVEADWQFRPAHVPKEDWRRFLDWRRAR